MARKLRIAIDCRITDSQQGIGTAVLALAKTFSDSDVTNQEYTFIVRQNMKGWLAPYVYGPCKLECIPESTRSAVKAVLRRVAPLRFIWQKLLTKAAYVPVSDGYVETHQFDVVHFPTQVAYLTELPTIYQPHDLQHLHYPQFFSKAEFSSRERLYRTFCDRASYVCVQTEWTKQDVIHHFEIAPEKVVVVPWGLVFDAYKNPSLEETRDAINKYGLPSSFFFYPAATWPHKNHETILRALHILKSEQGIAPHVFFTGSSTNHRPTLDKLAQSLGISEQLHFLGFVTPAELQAIFRTAAAMIYASRFEGFGLPILEAFHAQLPVLSSNASTLPEVARDGALFFDPNSPVELATLMKTVLDNLEVRQDLISRGTIVLSQYSFSDTAAKFQALYSRTAALSSQDHRLFPVPADGRNLPRMEG
jgi:glycosyltransferase involved in cell wall biosynthesis